VFGLHGNGSRGSKEIEEEEEVVNDGVEEEKEEEAAAMVASALVTFEFEFEF